MPKLKLTYFDFHGGRGEPARLAFHIGGIAFEDNRFAGSAFAEVRKSLPLKQVPVLEVDGVVVTQSDAITRYAGKLANLYPTDTFQALLCDEVLDAVEDVNVKLGTTFGLTGDALKEARTAFVTGPLPLYLRWLQTQLQAHGGNYFADRRPEGVFVCTGDQLRPPGPCTDRPGRIRSAVTQCTPKACRANTHCCAVLRQITLAPRCSCLAPAPKWADDWSFSVLDKLCTPSIPLTS
jgi:hypothetical protein